MGLSSRQRFLLVAVVLAISAGLLDAAQRSGKLRLIKSPLPILKPLKDLDRQSIMPLTVASSPALPPETVEELGTKEYINWVLRPAGADADQQSMIDLSVTYYTGVVDQVPHVPEECFHQGAFTQASDETVELDLVRTGRKIEARKLSFYPPRDVSKQVYVYYTICVNGDFYGNRTAVRLRMADTSESHLYYSKVEVSFRGPSDAAPASLDAKARQAMDGVIAELIRSHWPKRGSERGGTGVGADGKAGETSMGEKPSRGL